MNRSARLAPLVSVLIALALALHAEGAAAKPEFGPMINAFCTANNRTPANPYGATFPQQCTLCHAAGTFDKNNANRQQPAWDSFVAARGSSDFSFFCPAAPPVNRPPVLQPIGAKSASEGQLLAFLLSATDPENGRLTIEAGNLPTGATFMDQRDGTAGFGWTPGFGQSGNYTVRFIVTDDGSPVGRDQEDVTISVGNVNRPPVLGAIGPRAATEGQLLSVPVSASDPDRDAIGLAAASLPSGATFTDHQDGTGEIVWTPGVGQAGAYPVSVVATDGGSPMASDSEQFTITVNPTDQPPMNHAPVLDPIGSRSVVEGQPLAITLTASDVDGDTLAFDSMNAPAGAQIVDGANGSAQFLWTPAVGEVGNLQATFVVTEVGPATPASDFEDVTITVEPIGAPPANHPPVLDPIGSRTVEEGQELLIPITASDPDGDALGYSGTGLPAGAQLTEIGDGTAEIRWTPAPGQAGDHPVSVSVTDGAESDSEDVVFSVVPVPSGGLFVDRARFMEGHLLRVRGGAAPPRTRIEILEAETLTPIGVVRSKRNGLFKLTLETQTVPCAVVARAGETVSEALPVRFAPPSCGIGEEGLRVKKAELRLREHDDEDDDDEDDEEEEHGDQRRSEGANDEAENRGAELIVQGDRALAGAMVEIQDAAAGTAVGATQADSHGRFRFRKPLDTPPCAVRIGTGGNFIDPDEVEHAEKFCHP